MGSRFLTVIASLIGLLCLYASFRSPQPLIGLVGAAFFLGLAALNLWGRSPPHIFLPFGLVFGIHPILALFTGQISELTRQAPRTFSVAKEPQAFWTTFALYCLLALGAFSVAAYRLLRRRLYGLEASSQSNENP